jgi:glutamate dehydrogenase
LDRIKNVVRKEAYTEGRVLDTILEYPHLVKDLYKDFERFHRPNGTIVKPHFNDEIWARVRKTVMGDLDQQIFKAFLTFNQHILKTNFYKSEKLAISFRLNPGFLAGSYPVVPFGMFFVVGGEFRGFHVRFR